MIIICSKRFAYLCLTQIYAKQRFKPISGREDTLSAAETENLNTIPSRIKSNSLKTGIHRNHSFSPALQLDDHQ